MVQCLIPDRGVAGSSLTGGTALIVSLSKTLCLLLIFCLVLVQPRKTRPNIVDWDVKNHHKQTNKLISNHSNTCQIKSKKLYPYDIVCDPFGLYMTLYLFFIFLTSLSIFGTYHTIHVQAVNFNYL